MYYYDLAFCSLPPPRSLVTVLHVLTCWFEKKWAVHVLQWSPLYSQGSWCKDFPISVVWSVFPIMTFRSTYCTLFILLSVCFSFVPLAVFILLRNVSSRWSYFVWFCFELAIFFFPEHCCLYWVELVVYSPDFPPCCCHEVLILFYFVTVARRFALQSTGH